MDEVEVGDYLLLLKEQDKIEVDGETLHCITINPATCLLLTK